MLMRLTLVACLVMAVALTSCAKPSMPRPQPSTGTPTIIADVAPTPAEVPSVMAAPPTYTPYPTYTPLPTYTPYPTATERPTSTPAALPTSTLMPTSAPTPVPATSNTSTPTPVPVPTAKPTTAGQAPQGAEPDSRPRGTLLLSTYDATNGMQLMRFDLATGQIAPVKKGCGGVNYSPDYQYLGYSCAVDPSRLLSQRNAYIAKPDWSGERLVVSDAYSPSFSPHGDRLVLQRPDQNLYVVNADGSGLRLLTAGYNLPSWSPTDNWIAHRSCYGSQCGIYLTNADSGQRLRLTSGGNDDRPLWSKDGMQLVFQSDVDGNVEIYRIDRIGANRTRLTVNLGSDVPMAWSPDGEWIAFLSERNGAMAAYAMHPDGSSVRTLGTPYGAMVQAWGP